MGILVDGKWGPTTKRYLQSYLAHAGEYRGRIDGDFGPLSVKALQRLLKQGSFYHYYYGAVDGWAGPQTWNAWHWYLVDLGYGKRPSHNGKMDSKLCKMTQRFINSRSYLFR